ncbi:MAG TPA: hypothetical protein VGR50_05900 [Terriglobales bacterium]|nr:hypothetical protein [Terriglobales bacterium]
MAQKPSTLLEMYKIIRWVVLGVVVFLIFIALHRPAPPAPPPAPESQKINVQSFDQKLQDLATAHERGERTEEHFNADEVNAEIAHSLAEGDPEPGKPAPAAAPAGSDRSKQPQVTANSEVPENMPVQTVQVGFMGDEVTGQFSVPLYGKDVYITVSGKLGSKDGYVTFDPTGFRFGDLSIPVSWVNDALQRKLAEPENREKLKLPEFVADLKVQNGELVITEK